MAAPGTPDACQRRKGIRLRHAAVANRRALCGAALRTINGDQAVDKPCAEAAGPGPSRPAVNRVFIERYQAVNRSDHAQILCTRLCISCDQSAPAPAGTGLAAAGRETARRGGAATYPPATAGVRLRRGGLCTDAVEQTVHRLFGPGCSPGRARPSGNRAKIEQNQSDRRCLCTNAVRRSVHSLWAGGARPGPVGPGPGRALFAQSSGRTWSSRGDAWLLPAPRHRLAPAPPGPITPHHRQRTRPPAGHRQPCAMA